MRWKTGFGALVVAAGLGAVVVPAGAAPASATVAYAGPLAGEYVDGELVVGFTQGASTAEVGSAFARSAVAFDRSVSPRTQLVTVEPGQSMSTAIDALRRQPGVAFVEPNYITHISATPSDTNFSALWGLNNTGQTVNGTAGTADADIDAPEAWNISTGSTSVVVAIVDTGIDYNHPDLAGNLWTNPADPVDGVDNDGNGYVDDTHGWDFVSNDNDPRDYNVQTSHGTHVAGTIGARGNNALGVTGVNWQVSMVSLRVFNAEGSGTTAALAAAFNYAGNMGIKVVNYSGGFTAASAAVQAAITSHPNTLFVVAAGNSALNNDSTPVYPCSYPDANIICVAASTQTDTLASFSNYGATSVDIAAPGVNILSLAEPWVTPFSETFSTDPFSSSRWTKGTVIGTNNWSLESNYSPGAAVPSLTDGTPYLADYPVNSNTYVQTTSAINLAGFKGCSVVMPFWVDIYAPDADAFEVSLRADTAFAPSDIRQSWQGTGGVNDVVDATAFDGGPLYLRLGLNSDSSPNPAGFDGVYVDDIEVRCVSDTHTTADYRFLSGTSMATPHVTGAAALLLSVNSSLTTSQLKNAILTTGDDVAAFAGITTTGKRLNLFNAVKSIDTTAPAVTVTTPPEGASYTVGQTVNADYACADPGSGITSCSGPVANGAAIDTATPGSKSFAVTGINGNGQSTTVTHHYSVVSSVDSVPPSISVLSPVEGASYTVGQVVNASYSCADTGGSGLASCVGPVANGAAITTASPGTKTFTVNASDGAGNTNSVTTHYTVIPVTQPGDHGFVALSPSRLLDTRQSTSLDAGGTVNVPVIGRNGVPTGDVRAVLVNVTATNAHATGYMTVWPNGEARPLASTLNFASGDTVANLTVAKLGTDGSIDIWNSNDATWMRSTDVIVDVLGYFIGDPSIGALTPNRLLDTRGSDPLRAGGSLDLQVLGRGGVPTQGVEAVVLNVTVTDSGADGYLTTWPTGQGRPLASSLNFAAGRNVANLVVAKIGADGSISIWNSDDSASMRPTHVIVDVVGWLPTGSDYHALTPDRLVDTRQTSHLRAGDVLTLPVFGQGGVPLTGAGAVVLNVTVTGGRADGYLTTWPSGEARPVASSLNWATGETVANLVVAKVGADGSVAIWNSNDSAAMQDVDVVVDVLGWFSSQ